MKQINTSILVCAENVLETVQEHEQKITLLSEHVENNKDGIEQIKDTQKQDHKMLVAILLILGITTGGNLWQLLMSLL